MNTWITGFLISVGILWLLLIWWSMVAFVRQHRCDCDEGECRCLDDVEKYV